MFALPRKRTFVGTPRTRRVGSARLAEEAQNLRAQVSGFANTQRSISKLVDVFLSDLKGNFKIFTGLGEDLYVFCIPQARQKMGAGVPLACARSGMIEVWIARHGVAIADWPDQPVDPFFNVNTPEDAARVERIALQQAGT
jgi:hypothetical protein